MPLRHTLTTIAILVAATLPLHAQQADKEQLGRAIEYFQTAKYHECMLILARLDSAYTINPRFRAFLGVCYYYEGQYAKAAEYLEATIPQLRAFSPQELGLYNWLCGECLFKQEQWQRAIAYYEATTLMRHGNGKADALYRLGFCYINLHDMRVAKDYLESALAYYERAGSPDYKARVAQLRNMTAALRNYLGEE